MTPVNRAARHARWRSIAPSAALLLAILAGVACGEVPRAGDPVASPTEPVVVNAEGVPGAAGQALGPYTPTSDVSFEVRANAATEQLLGLLNDPAFVDWDAALESFEGTPAPIGGAVPPSLSAVAATAATGPTGAIYAEYFGSADWLRATAQDAILGSGEFAGQTDAERAARLANLVSIELPLLRAFVAAEAGERLTEAGDLDPRFGAPHEWDRLWVIVQGATALNGALTDETVAAIQDGAAAAKAGDTTAVRDARDVVQLALLRVALEGIAGGGGAPSLAFLRGVEPLLARVDASATRRLETLLGSDAPEDGATVRELAGQLADRAGVDGSFVLVES
jgi:hypothetical protein